MIKPGEEWGGPANGPPDVQVSGSDPDLAAAAIAQRNPLVQFDADADSDLARAVGLGAAGLGEDRKTGIAVPLDLLVLGDGSAAANMVVAGTAPDHVRWTTRRRPCAVTVDGTPWWSGRAHTIVVATGEFYRGLDLIPRGHPGDGRAEIQVYALAPGDRAAMRRRLATGSHLPHPQIATRSGRRISITSPAPLDVEVDGLLRGPQQEITVEIVPNAYRILL